MDAEVYVNILKDTLLPFISAEFPDSHHFMQDSDPKHTRRLAKAYLEEQSINWWHTPASSADINLFEHVSAELK